MGILVRGMVFQEEGNHLLVGVGLGDWSERALRCPCHAVLELEAEDCVDLIGVEWRRCGDAVADEGGWWLGNQTRGRRAGADAHLRSLHGDGLLDADESFRCRRLGDRLLCASLLCREERGKG
jgi:hypothetical protein